MSESPRGAEAEEPATSNSAAEGQQSPDENEIQDMNASALELGEQFEVKEQDRWLPIANGMFIICLVLRVVSRARKLPMLLFVHPLHDHMHVDPFCPRPRLNLHLYTSISRITCCHRRIRVAPASPRSAAVFLTRRLATIMSSASPQPAHKQPQRARAASNEIASDANIRNFAPVARIMKGALPENAKIAKEAKECMQECVSEFISFITSEGREQIA